MIYLNIYLPIIHHLSLLISITSIICIFIIYPYFIYLIMYLSLAYIYLSSIFIYYLSTYLSIYPLIICLLKWFLSIHLSFTHPPCIHLLTSSSSIYLSTYLPGISLTQTYIEESVLGQRNHSSSPLVQMCTHAISWL